MNINQPINVLLVEDEASDAQLVMIELRATDNQEFNVVWVESLKQVKQQLMEKVFDIILLDLSLSDSHGLDTINAVRTIANELPIVILTGYADTNFALKTLEAGAIDYVMKDNLGHDSLARIIRYALFRAELEEKNYLFSSALDAAGNAIIITDKNAKIIWVNQAFVRLTGYTLEESLGKTPKSLVSSHRQDYDFYQAMWRMILQGKQWRGELLNQRKDGSLYYEEMSIAPVKNKRGDITHFIGIKNDITERKQIEEQLQKLANTDPLTELYNRRFFLEQLAKETKKMKKSKKNAAALLMIDLDYFKRINDTYGHSTGDEVLRCFAEIMRQTCRCSDTPARLGGEEFAILLRGTKQQEAMSVAERLRQQIANTPIPHETFMVHVTISIGATALLADDIGGDMVLSRADAALYESKSRGRNQARWFDSNVL